MSSSLGTVAVLGGGISGLAAAYRLTQIYPTPKRIVLLEASKRFGGWIQTTRNEDGIIYETGPRTIRPVGASGITTLNLVDQLKLNDRVISIPKGHPSAINRLIYMNGRTVRLPTDMSAVFKTHPPFQRPLYKAIMQDVMTRRSKLPDESIHDFFTRRLGRDVAEFAADPLIRGVCAGDCREVSVHFLFKALKEYELQYGGITQGVIAGFFKKKPDKTGPVSLLAEQAVKECWSVWSLQGGLQTLPEVLAQAAADNGVELLTETPCTGYL